MSASDEPRDEWKAKWSSSTDPDEPREQLVADALFWRDGESDPFLHIEGDLSRVLAAVLAEVAEQESDGVLVIPHGEYEQAIYQAAKSIREAMRLRTEGA